MATNKIKKTLLIQWLITNTILFLVFISLFIFYFYPSIKVAIQDKTNLKTSYNQYKTIITKGISYDEFIALHATKEWEDLYKDNVIKTITADFYTNNIENTGEGDFEEYLATKTKEINSSEKSAWYQKSQEVISLLIPQYVGNSIDIGNSWNVLTDYMYVNYLENLFYKFNLETQNGGITINDTVPIDNTTTDPKEAQTKNKSIEANIFYIPIKFELKGKKKDVINFLYFAEKVWSVDISKNDEILIYNDRELASVFGNVRNPYEWQLFDIESITMKDYLDSLDTETIWGLINFVKSTQWSESYTIDVNLRFYVRWKPNYQLRNYITEELARFDELNKKVWSTLSRLNNMKEKSADLVVVANALRSLAFDMLNLEEKTKQIKLWYVKADSNLEDFYRQATQLKKTIDIFENIFNKNDEKIKMVTSTNK